MGSIRVKEALTLLCVALGLFIVVIDVTIVNIALPSIARELEVLFSEVQWVVIAYTLALTGLVPVCGRLSDLFGRKYLFILGQVIFVLSSLLAAQSKAIEFLIFSRVVQAIGAALISSNTLAIIADTFPPGRRGFAMGIQAILISGGAALGPSLGGFLVTHFGWPSIFYVNIPIGLIGILMSFKFLPIETAPKEVEKLDFIGSFLTLSGLASFFYGLTQWAEWGATPSSQIFMVLGFLTLAFLIYHQSHISHPLIDLNLFKNKEFAFGQLAGIFAMITLSGLSFLLPFYWQNLRGLDAMGAGLLMLPMPIAFMITSPLSGKISDKRGSRGIATLGLIQTAIVLYLLSQLNDSTPLFSAVWRLAFLGISLGMFMAPNNNAILSSVIPSRRGIASGLLGMFRYMGQSLGVAIAGAIFNFTLRHSSSFQGTEMSFARVLSTVPQGNPLPKALGLSFIQGFQWVCWTYIPLALIGAFLSYQRPKGDPNNF